MPDFRQAVEEARRAIAQAPVPAEVDRRIRERLAERRSRRRWVMIPVAAAAGAAAVALVLWPRPPAEPAPAALGAWALRVPTPDLQLRVDLEQRVEILSGGCTLVDPVAGAALEVFGPAVVRREPAGIRLISGTVVFSVDKRPAGAAPARVLVSHGTIEVLGTRFTVVQRPGGGSVVLHQGWVRFVAEDGRAVALMTPGASLAWPLAPLVPEPAPPPRVEPAPPPSARPARPAPWAPAADADPAAREEAWLEELLRTLDQLRGSGRYPEMAAELERALQGELRPPTRERLSYELGVVLTDRLAEPRPWAASRKRACAHWREHRGRFGEGRYLQEIAAAEERLGCAEEEKR